MKEKAKNITIVIIIVVLSFIIPLLTGCGIKGDLYPADEKQREPRKTKVLQ